MKDRLKVLITVKTYPIPSASYGELVCTAGVNENGEFIRLYPVNFRDQPFERQYRKYQWIEVEASRHSGRDIRKESYRPDCDTIELLGEPIPTKSGDWSDRARYVLQRVAGSVEELKAQQREELRAKSEITSLGIIRPREISDLIAEPAEAEWKPAFRAELRQARIWEDRDQSLQLPRKVPFRFKYVFTCDDPKCRGHRMMNEDWELGRFYWRLIDQGATKEEAIEGVRDKFLEELCGTEKDTHFYLGTVLKHPTSWLVIGVWWPKKRKPAKSERQGTLFGQSVDSAG